MKIVLSDDLPLLDPNERALAWAAEKTRKSIESHAAKVANVDRNKESLKIVRPLKDAQFFSQRGLLNTLSTAYDRHYGMIINPHDLWYLVLTQIAEEVNNNPKDYRSLFTSSSEKQLIKVPQNHPTDIDVPALITMLKAHVPGGEDTVELFLPELSTLTDDVRLAMAAAFCSTVRQYYDYGMFCCGIPFVELRGSKYDWQLLSGNCLDLCDFFDGSKKMVKYLVQVHLLLKQIAQTFDHGVDIDFWKDIYREKNVGSGSDLSVNGWITKFYLKGDNSLLKSFHDSMSAFEYVDLHTKQKYVMVHGAFNAKVVNDNSIQAGYDYTTFEIIDEAKEQSSGIAVEKINLGGFERRKLADGWTHEDGNKK